MQIIISPACAGLLYNITMAEDLALGSVWEAACAEGFREWLA
jgi:hypothetical protein